MRGFRQFSIVVLLVLFFPTAALTALAKAPLKPTEGLNGPPTGIQTVTLGNATVPLDGLWKFRTGDNMAWAQPGSYNPILGSSGFVPGWTARGYKGYSGYAWYRLRVNIQSNQSALSLKMPDSFDDAYQVYVNGQRIGQFGRFAAEGVTAYISQPRAFPLPADVRSGPATIAIRMWMSNDTSLVDLDAGGLHGPPVLGRASALAALVQMDWDAVNRSSYSEFAEMAILLLALLVAFALFRLDRREAAYLWLGLACAATFASNFIISASFYSTWFTGTFVFLAPYAILGPLDMGLWVVFWAYWFRLGDMARLHRIVWSLVVLLGIGVAMQRAPLYGSVVPIHASVWLVPLTDLLNGLLGLVLVWVAVRGIRKNKAEGWIALPALALVALSRYGQVFFDFLHWKIWYTGFFPFGIFIGLGQIGLVLSLALIVVLLLRRFLHSQREREQWKLEIEQARQVQQMLIPEALPTVPGLHLESEYRPAQQVGGDFLQIIPDKVDGSALIVVGDVTGHGLQAGMLVALIVGAIRNEVAHTDDPRVVLNALNRTLCGRSHAHATCLALRIETDGAATLANAGHLPPYLNGKELPMEGALPLGMVPEAEFSLMQFHLAPGDRLTLLTDGVPEAMNVKRELFGFARAHAAMQGEKSAAEIAAEAQAFGQQDDITVVRVTREASAVNQIAGVSAVVAG